MNSGKALRCLVGLAVLALAHLGTARGEILDDSLSPRQQHRLRLKWLNEGQEQRLSPADLNQMVGELPGVDIRLDTKKYVGSHGRIYLRLPRVTEGTMADGDLRLAWTTDGLFNSGEVTPGARGLLYEGVIDQPVLREVFDFRIYFRSIMMRSALRIEPIFEIEAL